MANRGYINFINQQKRLLLTDEFMLLVEDQSYMAAANKLIAARQFSPEKNYREEVLSKQESLIEKLHEQAIILRKNQNLDEAIIRWKKILAISPSNKLAKKYYSRTSKLLSKLKQLN